VYPPPPSEVSDKLITFGFFRGESTAFLNVNICSGWLATIRREAAETDKTSARIIVNFSCGRYIEHLKLCLESFCYAIIISFSFCNLLIFFSLEDQIDLLAVRQIHTCILILSQLYH